MKKISLVLVLVFISFGSFAQGNKKDKMEKHHENHNMSAEIDNDAHAMMYADKMTTRLNLTLEQKEQIREAQMRRLSSQKEMMGEMMSESGNMGGENAEKHEEKMKIQNDFKEEMKEILTPAQYKEWEPMHKREMKMHGEMKDKEMKMDKKKSKNKGKDKDEYEEEDTDDY